MAFQKKKRLKQPTDYSYVKKTLYLNPEDPFQEKLIRLLELCPRREAKILGIITNEFLSENPILDESPELLKDYINLYNKFRDSETQPSFCNVTRHIREGETLNALPTPIKEQHPTCEIADSCDNPVFDLPEPTTEQDSSVNTPVNNPDDLMKKALAAFM